MDDKAAALDAQVSSSQVVLFIYTESVAFRVMLFSLDVFWYLEYDSTTQNTSLNNDIDIATVHLQ